MLPQLWVLPLHKFQDNRLAEHLGLLPDERKRRLEP
jgi:hypothetical protein